MNAADTTDRLDVDAAQQRADEATTAADALRDRVAAGEPVTAADLAAAEADERLTRLQLDAARRRADAQAEHDAVEQLDQARDELRAEWETAHSPDAGADLQRLLDTAVDAAAVYLQAAQRRYEHLADLAERAQALGFAADRPRTRNPLHDLGPAIVNRARGFLPDHYTHPLASNIWGP
jgi:DNA repair exonuclease SbcCD ATPase subunit